MVRRGPTEFRIGTSGWRYPHWRNNFYPPGLAQKNELAYLAEHFNTVELNGSFYSLQRPSSYRRWRQETPDGFVFAVKGGKFITHNKKLRDVAPPLANFFASGPLALGERLGPFLWQLPPALRFDAERMEEFFELLPGDVGAAVELAAKAEERVISRFKAEPGAAPDLLGPDTALRHAIEVRHPSFEVESFYDLCRRFGIAIVLADSAGRFPVIDQSTAEFSYIRLHGSQQLYSSRYTDEEIRLWAERIGRASGSGTYYVYFDNDFESNAAFDARRLIQSLPSTSDVA
ncbi:Uncharacterized conserved protein YecE, DUF72 family [Nakamurella panacisegetis]|uniref:Uncharacterized conserved protein YecE, DUF72 family n=1 Tax=Nakamurella panacisegetis TaxID=1090615 RepID=A0A1H0RGF0_9ACTN|nr:DUF72 domain-containing protein [Nakamurella panacisegetis]SDP28643.1 Uncharacterized conserved protein YecE, DUF72 family [Nakamurella panacisegetis]